MGRSFAPMKKSLPLADSDKCKEFGAAPAQQQAPAQGKKQQGEGKGKKGQQQPQKKKRKRSQKQAQLLMIQKTMELAHGGTFPHK